MKKFLVLVLASALSHTVMAKTDSVKLVYGDDNREDIADIKNAKIKTISKAIAGRIHHFSYDYVDKKKKQNVFFYNPTTLSDPWGGNVCADEKFASQPVLVDCTGFLVGEDLLVTAGHCMLYTDGQVKNEVTDQCSEYQWLFDFEVNGPHNMDLNKVNKNKIYGCKKVVYAKMDEENDFALIQLDRKVTDRVYLKVRKSGKISDNTSLYVIGHPSGLPKKYAPGAFVIKNDKKHFFTTNLDTFGGNSGSPVFNAQTNEVEGILVRGKTDYVESQKPGESCMRVNRCNAQGKECTENDDEIDGEQVTRITDLKDYIK